MCHRSKYTKNPPVEPEYGQPGSGRQKRSNKWRLFGSSFGRAGRRLFLLEFTAFSCYLGVAHVMDLRNAPVDSKSGNASVFRIILHEVCQIATGHNGSPTKKSELTGIARAGKYRIDTSVPGADSTSNIFLLSILSTCDDKKTDRSVRSGERKVCFVVYSGLSFVQGIGKAVLICSSAAFRISCSAKEMARSGCRSKRF